MFKKRKRRKKDNNTANEKLARKILGKDTGRSLFAFPCSPDIKYRFKMLADELDVPYYGLGEHCIQISAGLIAKIKENSEETDMLRKHIKEVHVGARTIEIISRYDQDMAEVLNQERVIRFEMEKAAHQIVVTLLRRGIKPKIIMWAADYGLRCRIAVARGEPIPTDLPPDD